jgi:D-arabinose 1-dehydrogenase-like Zn-dependent alcohol dehydrogenase
MRAFQIVEFGAPLEPRVLPDPRPAPRDVVIDVASCGLSIRTAVSTRHVSLGGEQKLPVGMLGIQTPATFGHEIYGKIASVRPGIESDAGRCWSLRDRDRSS